MHLIPRPCIRSTSVYTRPTIEMGMIYCSGVFKGGLGWLDPRADYFSYRADQDECNYQYFILDDWPHLEKKINKIHKITRGIFVLYHIYKFVVGTEVFRPTFLKSVFEIILVLSSKVVQNTPLAVVNSQFLRVEVYIYIVNVTIIISSQNGKPVNFKKKNINLQYIIRHKYECTLYTRILQ